MERTSSLFGDRRRKKVNGDGIRAIALLSNETEPLSLTQLMAKCQGSQVELFKAIQSLARRGTIAKSSCETETVFTIPPVLKQYVKMVGE